MADFLGDIAMTDGRLVAVRRLGRSDLAGLAHAIPISWTAP
ncbi:MAG: hypothetical protein V4510_06200 [bacterium]